MKQIVSAWAAKPGQRLYARGAHNDHPPYYELVGWALVHDTDRPYPTDRPNPAVEPLVWSETDGAHLVTLDGAWRLS